MLRPGQSGTGFIHVGLGSEREVRWLAASGCFDFERVKESVVASADPFEPAVRSVDGGSCLSIDTAAGALRFGNSGGLLSRTAPDAEGKPPARESVTQSGACRVPRLSRVVGEFEIELAPSQAVDVGLGLPGKLVPASDQAEWVRVPWEVSEGRLPHASVQEVGVGLANGMPVWLLRSKRGIDMLGSVRRGSRHLFAFPISAQNALMVSTDDGSEDRFLLNTGRGTYSFAPSGWEDLEPEAWSGLLSQQLSFSGAWSNHGLKWQGIEGRAAEFYLESADGQVAPLQLNSEGFVLDRCRDAALVGEHLLLRDGGQLYGAGQSGLLVDAGQVTSLILISR